MITLKIGITSNAYSKFGLERYKRIRADGYEFCDLNLSDTETELYNCTDEQFLSILANERALAESSGVTIWQVHGPWRYPPQDETVTNRAERLEKMKKCIKATALLGCKYFVIHPIMPFGTAQNIEPEKTFQLNVEFFKALMPTAKENGVCICLENMPMKRITISTPTQIAKIINKIDDPNFKMCLDTGHCAVFGINPGDEVRKFGNLVKVLHIHDNNGERDEHLFPLSGIIDWDDFVLALKETEFDGVLSIETTPDPILNPKEYDIKNKELALIAKKLVSKV